MTPSPQPAGDWADLLDWRPFVRTLLAIFFNSSKLADQDPPVERLKSMLRILVWGAIFVGLAAALARTSGWTWEWKGMGLGALLSAGQLLWLRPSLSASGNRGVVAAFTTYFVFSCLTIGAVFALPDHRGVQLLAIPLLAVMGPEAFLEHVHPFLEPARAAAAALSAVTLSGIVARMGTEKGAMMAFLALTLAGAPMLWVLLAAGMDWVCISLLPRRSAPLDWLIGLVALIGLGYGGGLALSHEWPGEFTAWIYALTVFLIYTRLPLWPLEAGWAVLAKRRAAEKHQPLDLDTAYFDVHMVFKLPGEMGQMIALDAAELAARRALWSHHLKAGVGALRKLSGRNPLSVQATIWRVSKIERDRLFTYVSEGVKEGRAQVWEAQSLVLKLSALLQERAALTHQSDKRTQPGRSAAAEMGLPEAEVIKSSIDGLIRAASHLELASEYDIQMKHVGALGRIYGAIALALRAENLRDIHTWPIPPLEPVPTVAPAVIAILTELDKVANTLRALEKTTSLVGRGSILLQAGDELEQVAQALRDPGLAELDRFGALLHFLRFVVIRWRSTIASAGAEETRQTPARVKNPYVVGDPVTGHLFVGRDDILNQIEELWTAEGTLPSIVIYGHRRMGKSSILQNLAGHFGKGLRIIYFNMQHRGIVKDTAELLYSLALTIYSSLTSGQQKVIKEPLPFRQGNATTGFNAFMESLRPVRDHSRLIILIDEYEIIERGIQQGKFDPNLMDYFRGLVQNIGLRLTVCFAGLHTLEEMTHSYWHPFFAGLKKIQVSFLSPEASLKLITQPVPDFDFNYDPGVPERIIELTHGQPYLVQLVGHTLIRRFNRNEARAKKQLDRRFTLEDLEQVIHDQEFFADGDAYFDGVKDQAASNPPNQQAVLRELVGGPARLEDLAVRCEAPVADIRLAIEALVRHAVILETKGEYRYAVELMRVWYQQQVKGEVEK